MENATFAVWLDVGRLADGGLPLRKNCITTVMQNENQCVRT